MIDWDENAISAVKEFYRWANLKHRAGCSADTDKFFSELDVNRPTQKTVADAVEYYNGEFPEGQAILGIAYSNNKITPYYAGSPISDGTNSSESYIICTRQQFETYAKEQEAKQDGEKWTHFVDDDEGQLTKCRKHLKLCNGRDWVYVCEKGEYFVPSKMGYCGVKPIKPTISTREYDMLAKYAAALNVDPAQFEQYMSDNYDSQLKD